MTLKKSWLRMVVAGLLLAGCGGPMEPVAGEGQEGGTPAGTHATSSTAPASTPPAVVELDPRMDLRALWPTTASVRRFVVLVAYTMSPDVSGYTPPPRFRAFGVDASTQSYVFQVDGDRATYLNSFTEAMFSKGAVIIATPPGMMFESAGTPITPVLSFGANGAVSASDIDIDFGTEPVVRSGGSTGTGGHDPWYLNWLPLLDLVSYTNGAFSAGNYEYLTRKLVGGILSEAPEER